MGVWEDELASRDVPYTSEEIWAIRNRPTALQPARPTEGAATWFRAQRWAEPIRARVLTVTPTSIGEARKQIRELGEADPNVWQIRRSPYGAMLTDDEIGLPLIERLPDPNPLVLLMPVGWRTPTWTREARLRGDCGWLPEDWRERVRPIPRPTDTPAIVIGR